MMTSARMVTPGHAMATIPMMRESTPIRINEVDVDLNMVGIPLASMALLRVSGQRARNGASSARNWPVFDLDAVMDSLDFSHRPRGCYRKIVITSAGHGAGQCNRAGGRRIDRQFA